MPNSEDRLLSQLCEASIGGEREFQLLAVDKATFVRHSQLPSKNLDIDMSDFVLLREAGALSVIEESAGGCTFVVSQAGIDRAAAAD